MASSHPLDCVTWSALTGRQSHLGLVHGVARRYAPDFGVFAGLGGVSSASLTDLSALIVAHGDVALLQPDAPPPAPGVTVASQAPGVQMVADRLARTLRPAFPMIALGQAEAADMLALADLTQPGPFFARTRELGEFFGVRIDGALVAMAGERMKPDGYTEISAVCTHPDHRGQSYAAALTNLLARRILDRGERPFLHAYAGNAGAIALYERLGFRLRRHVSMTRLTAATPA